MGELEKNASLRADGEAGADRHCSSSLAAIVYKDYLGLAYPSVLHLQILYPRRMRILASVVRLSWSSLFSLTPVQSRVIC